MDKFLGIGLTNAVGLWLLFMVFTLIAKVVFTMYPVEGISDVVLVAA